MQRRFALVVGRRGAGAFVKQEPYSNLVHLRLELLKIGGSLYVSQNVISRVSGKEGPN